jgi:ArsR family transcriptional regulator
MTASTSAPTAPPTTDPALDTEVLRLLADPTRAAIVALLAVEQLCTCHLVEELGATQTNISNHLRAMRHAGIVKAEPAGRFTYYRLQPGILRTLAGQLGDLADSAVTAEQVRRPCG